MVKKRSNGEGNLWHDEKRGRWEARFTVGVRDDGTPIRKKVTGRTMTEARDRMRDAQDAAKSGETRARADLSVGRFLDEWRTNVIPGSVAPATEQQYNDVIRLYIKPQVGRKKLATLNARDVSGMVRALANAGLSPNTQRLARSVLRRALRWAEHEGLVARNVAAIAFGVRVPAPAGRTMTVDEARSLLAAIKGERLEAAWIVMLTLGLRRGELLGLAWSDLKLEGPAPSLTVQRTVKRLPGRGLHVDDTKTRTSRRTVRLPAPTAEALRAHRARQKAERSACAEWVAKPLGFDLVFRTPFGTPLDPDNLRHSTYRVTARAEVAALLAANPKIVTAARKAGIGDATLADAIVKGGRALDDVREKVDLGPIDGIQLDHWSPHELRHVAASLLIAQGVPLKTISETLGHSSIRVTADVYGHLLEDARAEAAAAMERVIG
jgi:integrase